MSVEDDDDRATFLETDEHAVEVVYNGVPVDVIFDKHYFESQAGDAGIQGSQPTVLGLTSDFSAATHGQTVVYSGVTYKIVGVEPDGVGMTLVRLERQ